MHILERLMSNFGQGVFKLTSGDGEVYELPNLITLLNRWVIKDPTVASFLHQWEGIIYALFIAALIIFLAKRASTNMQLIPGRFQSVAEMLIEWLDDFICGILGPAGKKHVPFLGTLFIYILFMNLSGVLPAGKSPTASPNTTLALALSVFLYANFIGLKENGPVGYVKHLMGSPQSAVEWAFVPIMLPIHILGEIAKPVSLALRLFGNVTGEDVLLFAFCSLGVAALSFMDSPVGIPFQTPFILLAFLTSTIQALVFTLLSTIYILLWLPHDHGDHGEAGQH